MCYLYGETPLVNCGPRSFLLILLQSSTAALFTFLQFTFSKQFSIHTIRLILCVQQNQWDWQPHWIVGAKYLGCLCADSKLLLTPVVRPAISPSATPSEETPFSYWSINLGFVIEGNLAACSSHLALGVHQLRSINLKHQEFLALLPGIIFITRSTSRISGAVAGEKDHFCKGSLSLSIFLFCFCFSCFILFYFVCVVLSKTQKN